MSPEELQKLMALAHLKPTAKDSESLKLKISQILEAFEKMKSLPTDDVEALFHFEEQMPLREDVPEEALDQESLLDNAPEAWDGCFKIPKVLGESQ